MGRLTSACLKHASLVTCHRMRVKFEARIRQSVERRGHRVKRESHTMNVGGVLSPSSSGDSPNGAAAPKLRLGSVPSSRVVSHHSKQSISHLKQTITARAPTTYVMTAVRNSATLLTKTRTGARYAAPAAAELSPTSAYSHDRQS